MIYFFKKNSCSKIKLAANRAEEGLGKPHVLLNYFSVAANRACLLALFES
jgi:hypothetical protein